MWFSLDVQHKSHRRREGARGGIFLYTVAEHVVVMVGPHWFGGLGSSGVTGSGRGGGVDWDAGEGRRWLPLGGARPVTQWGGDALRPALPLASRQGRGQSLGGDKAESSWL